MRGNDTVKFEPSSGEPARATYAYDDETGILAMRLSDVDSGALGTIELSDYGGGIVLLLTADGAIGGVEIVVWPEVAPDEELQAPHPTAAGGVTAPTGIEEIECDIYCRVAEDGRTLHLIVEDGLAAQTIKVADKLLVDLDSDSELAGVWLLQVPEGVSATV